MSESRLEVLQADYATLLERWKEEQTKRIEAEQQRDMTGRLSEGLEADLTDRICEVNDLKAENRRLLDRLHKFENGAAIVRGVIRGLEQADPTSAALPNLRVAEGEFTAVEGLDPNEQKRVDGFCGKCLQPIVPDRLLGTRCGCVTADEGNGPLGPYTDEVSRKVGEQEP